MELRQMLAINKLHRIKARVRRMPLMLPESLFHVTAQAAERSADATERSADALHELRLLARKASNHDDTR